MTAVVCSQFDSRIFLYANLFQGVKLAEVHTVRLDFRRLVSFKYAKKQLLIELGLHLEV